MTRFEQPQRPGEDRVAARILAASASGNGDDTATLAVPGARVCVSTDSTVAGVHAPRTTSPHALGRRAAARALSDLAACAARPIGLTCAVLVPPDSWDFVEDALAGVRERALEQGCDLVGGDLASAHPLSDRLDAPLALVVTVLGVPAGARGRPLLRSGARQHDLVCVTGQLGAAGHALRAGDPVLPEPPDRIAAGLALGPHATAAIDLSDGIARDASHLAAASRLALDLDLGALPLAPGVTDRAQAATDGDDYELLVTIPPDRLARARDQLDALGVALTTIGRVTPGPAGVHWALDGRPVHVGPGFTHG